MVERIKVEWLEMLRSSAPLRCAQNDKGQSSQLIRFDPPQDGFAVVNMTEEQVQIRRSRSAQLKAGSERCYRKTGHNGASSEPDWR